jgi:hypothetical protein
MTMLTPIHVENSGPLLGSNRPIKGYLLPPKTAYIHCATVDLALFRTQISSAWPETSSELSENVKGLIAIAI